MDNEVLVKSYQSGNIKALDELTEQNMGLVHFIARKCCHNENNYEDAVQWGWFGLRHAARVYKADHPKAAKFSTYAAIWIRQSILRYNQNTHNDDEFSIQESIAEDLTLEDSLEDVEASRRFWDDIERKELRHELNVLMAKSLSQKETEVIKLRVGWDDDREQRFEDIAGIYSENKKKIYQDYCRGIDKLRHTPWGRMRRKEKFLRKIAANFYKNPLKMVLVNK